MILGAMGQPSLEADTLIRHYLELLEWTFNVGVNGNGSARALEEDGEPTASQPLLTVAAEEVSPQTAELPPVPSASDRERAAHEIIRKCRDRGWQIGPDGSLDVLPVLRGKTDPPEDRHRAMLAAVLPEVLAIKFPPTSTAGPGVPLQGKPAPPVPRAVQAKARALISALPGHPDPGIEASVSRAIAEALNDHAAQSLALFAGLAGEVRRGVLAIGCLLDAFEAGCSRTARNRGTMFTQAIKASIGMSRRFRAVLAVAPG
jgi:hypothetical protein